MQNDKTTLKDLSIFSTDGGGVFALIDRTTTQYGRDMLRRHIEQPADSYSRLVAVQAVVRFWSANLELWPKGILNGTLVMLDKFFESADVAPPSAGIALTLSAFFQKLLHKQEYFFIQFSLSHLADFFRGLNELTAIAAMDGVPQLLKDELANVTEEMAHPLVPEILAITPQTSFAQLTQLNYKARRELKNKVSRLMNSYARLDAWQAMARATAEHGWTFPALAAALPVQLVAEGLSHPLLPSPVAYDIKLDVAHNFLLLTGANMSGKTTFMRSLGVGALLAHLGMGVPARKMQISFLQGVITNMQVEDNILRGESYFFAEVQRMKQTATRLLQPLPHLVLMDELFKGTNVHDAYECTRAVMEGLMNHPGHLMILSTHLYEVAQQFSTRPELLFAYFVTTMTEDGNYKFTYELKPGISNDRIGYRILQQEGVIGLLNTKPTDIK